MELADQRVGPGAVRKWAGRLMRFLSGLLGGVAALGLLVLVSAWTPGRVRAPSLRVGWSWRVWLAPVTVGIVGAAVVLALTGWVVGAVAGAVAAVVGWRSLGRRLSGWRVEQARVEALAVWCEQLRDLLSADQGIVGTIEATVRTCPEPLRPAVARLATGLSRQSPQVAVGQFADDVDDPSGDLVASVIVLAMSRSSRTAEMLSELAQTIRDRAAMRLRVEAERSGQRSEARFVIGFSAVVVVGVLVFGRDTEFLDAYGDITGQLVLGLVGLLFAIGVSWMSRLTRFERPARFLRVAVSGEVES